MTYKNWQELFGEHPAQGIEAFSGPEKDAKDRRVLGMTRDEEQYHVHSRYFYYFCFPDCVRLSNRIGTYLGDFWALTIETLLLLKRPVFVLPPYPQSPLVEIASALKMRDLWVDYKRKETSFQLDQDMEEGEVQERSNKFRLVCFYLYLMRRDKLTSREVVNRLRVTLETEHINVKHCKTISVQALVPLTTPDNPTNFVFHKIELSFRVPETVAIKIIDHSDLAKFSRSSGFSKMDLS
jgi:hypothetical protein